LHKSINNLTSIEEQIKSRFNQSTNLKIIALGGINKKNYKKLKSTQSDGFASISWAKKNGLRKLRPLL